MRTGYFHIYTSAHSHIFMWAVKDSNLRTPKRTDLQSVAFNHSANYPNQSHSRRNAFEPKKGVEPATC